MKRKKRILIAGGSHSDIPMIQAAKTLGYYVITSGNRADDIGHRYSDEIHLQDYSDKEKMLALAKELKIDAICASSNDYSLISSAYIAETLGLPGFDSYETTLLLHRKDRYRVFAQTHDILSPKAWSCSTIEEAEAILKTQSFPVMVKPVNLTGGKGIKKVFSILEGLRAVQEAFERSHVPKAVIEEYIDGSLHSCSTFIRNGKVVFHFCDNEYSYINPYLVSTSSSPALVAEVIIQQVIASVEKVAALLDLRPGLMHVQFLVRDNCPYIVEITRRMPGDLYALPVGYSTGVDYGKWVVKAAAGSSISDLYPRDQCGFFSRHCVMSPEAGWIDDVIYDDRIKPNIIEEFMWWERGDKVEDIMTYKAGIVFLRFRDIDEMRHKISIINNFIRIVVK